MTSRLPGGQFARPSLFLLTPNRGAGRMVKQVSPLPSVDALLRAPETEMLLIQFGRAAVTAALRDRLSAHRRDLPATAPAPQIIGEAADQLSARFARSQRSVFNMT